MSTVLTVKELFARAAELDGQRITVRGLWDKGFEQSAFERAWLAAPRGFPDRADNETLYVRVSGTFRNREGGHFGMWPCEIEADTIEELPLEPERKLGPGELAIALAEGSGQLVEANVTVQIGHACFRVDDVALRRFEREPLDPIEGPARVLAWLDLAQSLTVLQWSWTGEPRPAPVPRVGGDELHRHRRRIVEVEGRLRAGEYWPVIGAEPHAMELVPPEITTTARAYLAFGRAVPLPAEVVSWRTRLAAGPVVVRARGMVDERHFSAYSLEVVG